jgi:hypothetical protein
MRSLMGLLRSLSIFVYRVFLHPLNDYPGPLLCKITRFIATYHVIRRDTHVWLDDLHNKVCICLCCPRGEWECLLMTVWNRRPSFPK